VSNPVTITIDGDSVLEKLGVDAHVLLKRVIQPVMKAPEEGLSYTDKMLQMIESNDVLPNELAYLSVTGIEHLFILMKHGDKLEHLKDIEGP
jgi:hypothetical protein